MLVAMIDWTAVLVVGVPAYIAALGVVVVGVITARNGRKLATAEGEPLGAVVEKTHKLAVDTAETVHKINGDVPNG